MAEVPPVAESTPPPAQSAPATSTDGSTKSKTNVVGEHNITGERVTVIQGGDAATAVQYCKIGNERIGLGEDTFRCPECLKSPICVDHFNPPRGLCQTCVKSAETLEMLNRDEIVIDPMGQVVEKSKVRAQDGTLVTEDGERVANIKPTVWYARPSQTKRAKQWHEIKPKLLQREQQAVASMYPGMKMGTTKAGSKFWAGALSTNTGNTYAVRIQYPPNFPYMPPKAYVTNPKIEESRHIYKDGHLCLFHKDDKVWQAQTTAATVVSWAALWLHCYEVWKETGEWPRPERDQVVVKTEY
ncbi:MAG: hypothetical protein QF898_12450 [SAR202 cluster bacterium]|nr:hypothetical protein [SAR202 cluster bacterium]MDP6714956.1 hypothetical protein [SAR202 cluster bacterium]